MAPPSQPSLLTMTSAGQEEAAKVVVAIRCRPWTREKTADEQKLIVKMQNEDEGVPNGKVVVWHPQTGEEQEFLFDHAFWSFDPADAHHRSQKEVYEALGRRLLDDGLQGYNAVLFAYGHTGSGKTFSMAGTADEPGITPQFIEELFVRRTALVGASTADERVTIKLHVSYLEIYMEKLRDLLVADGGTDANAKPLKVREHKKLGPYVEGLKAVAVDGPEQMAQLMEEGDGRRRVAETAMNATSSRSHAMFIVSLLQARLQRNSEGQEVVTEVRSKIYLVDLAGSERAKRTEAQGQQLKEGGAINKSLLTLSMVIRKLAEGAEAGHVPHRDSMLTWLLKDCLGGNSRAAMLAAITPGAADYEETLSTLRYAASAKKIVNRAVINRDPISKLIAELKAEMEARSSAEKAEIEELRAQLEELERLKDAEEAHEQELLRLRTRLERANQTVMAETALRIKAENELVKHGLKLLRCSRSHSDPLGIAREALAIAHSRPLPAPPPTATPPPLLRMFSKRSGRVAPAPIDQAKVAVAMFEAAANASVRGASPEAFNAAVAASRAATMHGMPMAVAMEAAAAACNAVMAGASEIDAATAGAAAADAAMVAMDAKNELELEQAKEAAKYELEQAKEAAASVEQRLRQAQASAASDGDAAAVREALIAQLQEQSNAANKRIKDSENNLRAAEVAVRAAAQAQAHSLESAAVQVSDAVGQLHRFTSEIVQIQSEIVTINVQSRLLQSELDSYVAGGMCIGKRLKVQGSERAVYENELSKLIAARPTHEARLQDKRQQVDKFKDSMRQRFGQRFGLPSYWEQAMALSSDRGYALHEVNAGNDGKTYELLQRFLCTTKPHELGVGRDVKWAGKYTKLELQRAWRIEHPRLYERFRTGRSKVGNDVERVERCNTYKAPSTNIELADLAKKMPGSVDAQSHEHYLLHGTKPEVLPDLLNDGLNERFSGGLFGNGTYLAEDAAKIDQYVFPDPDPELNKDFSALHKLLYPAGGAHPGTTSDPVFYCLVCRVALGLPVRTQDAKQNMDNTSRSVWAVEDRELANIDTGGAVDPPVRHHSLLAELGPKIMRFREIIVTHGEYIYPEYLLAYKRKP